MSPNNKGINTTTTTSFYYACAREKPKVFSNIKADAPQRIGKLRNDKINDKTTCKQYILNVSTPWLSLNNISCIQKCKEYHKKYQV